MKSYAVLFKGIMAVYPSYEPSTYPTYDVRESAHDMGCPCGDATEAEVEYYENDIMFWLEAVAVPAVGVVGLICNVVAIPILLSR